MAYSKQTWADAPSTDSPLSAARLNHIEDGIDDAAAVADTAVQPGGTATLTNKRITKRVESVTSSATPTVDSDDHDSFVIAALTHTITDLSVTGTPTDDQPLKGRITASGADRDLTLGSDWNDVGGDFPGTIPQDKTLHFAGFYNDATDAWDVLAWKLEA